MHNQRSSPQRGNFDYFEVDFLFFFVLLLNPTVFLNFINQEAHDYLIGDTNGTVIFFF